MHNESILSNSILFHFYLLTITHFAESNKEAIWKLKPLSNEWSELSVGNAINTERIDLKRDGKYSRKHLFFIYTNTIEVIYILLN